MSSQIINHASWKGVYIIFYDFCFYFPINTSGVDFYSKSLRTEDKRIVSLQLWDTAGQERFQSVTKAYYRGAQGVVLMYDISQEESFLAVKTWINSIHENTDFLPAAMILVGNKVDLEECGEREVSTETGETFAKVRTTFVP